MITLICSKARSWCTWLIWNFLGLAVIRGGLGAADRGLFQRAVGDHVIARDREAGRVDILRAGQRRCGEGQDGKGKGETSHLSYPPVAAGCGRVAGG